MGWVYYRCKPDEGGHVLISTEYGAHDEELESALGVTDVGEFATCG